MMQWECAEKQYIYIKKKGLIQLFQWIMAPVRHEPRSVNTKKAFDWLAVINPLTHTLPYVVWQHPIYSWDFLFFFKCNRAHVCTLLGITNRLKVVVEAGEEHLYAAWDEPGSAEGKTALVPSRWPAGAPTPPPHIFYGLLGIYINFTKASTFMSSAGTREEWANCPRGANKMWDWNE